jgi:hypothetical protein
VARRFILFFLTSDYTHKKRLNNIYTHKKNKKMGIYRACKIDKVLRWWQTSGLSRNQDC